MAADRSEELLDVGGDGVGCGQQAAVVDCRANEHVAGREGADAWHRDRGAVLGEDRPQRPALACQREHLVVLLDTGGLGAERAVGRHHGPSRYGSDILFCCSRKERIASSEIVRVSSISCATSIADCIAAFRLLHGPRRESLCAARLSSPREKRSAARLSCSSASSRCCVSGSSLRKPAMIVLRASASAGPTPRRWSMRPPRRTALSIMSAWLVQMKNRTLPLSCRSCSLGSMLAVTNALMLRVCSVDPSGLRSRNSSSHSSKITITCRSSSSLANTDFALASIASRPCSMNVPGLSDTIGHPRRSATAFTSVVLDVPGGPNSSTDAVSSAPDGSR